MLDVLTDVPESCIELNGNMAQNAKNLIKESRLNVFLSCTYDDNEGLIIYEDDDLSFSAYEAN